MKLQDFLFVVLVILNWVVADPFLTLRLKDAFLSFWNPLCAFSSKYKYVFVNIWLGYLFVNLAWNLFLPGTVGGSYRIFSFMVQDWSTMYYLLACNLFWFFFVMALTFRVLMKIHPFFRWSWLGNNVGLMPLQMRYFSFLFIILLVLNLPSITCFEESVFRLGTVGWSGGIARSVAFGLTHIALGIPIGVGIAQIVLGLWLTKCYLMAGSTMGIVFSIMNHTMFNLIGCFMMLMFLIKTHMKAKEESLVNLSVEKETS